MLAAMVSGVTAVIFGFGLSTSLNRFQADLSRAAAERVQVLLGGRQGQSLINGKSAAPASPAAQEHAGQDVLHAQPGTLHRVTEASGRISLPGQPGQLSLAGSGGDASWTGYAMIAGHWHDGPGQVDVSTVFLTATGATVGQQYTLASGGMHVTVQIGGEIFDPAGGQPEMTGAISALSAVDPGLAPDEYLVQVKPGTGIGSYVNALSSALGEGYLVSATDRGGAALPAIEGLAGTLTLVIALVAGLGVLNTVVLPTREGVHDLGVFKAVGMTPRQTITMVVSTVSRHRPGLDPGRGHPAPGRAAGHGPCRADRPAGRGARRVPGAGAGLARAAGTGHRGGRRARPGRLGRPHRRRAARRVALQYLARLAGPATGARPGKEFRRLVSIGPDQLIAADQAQGTRRLAHGRLRHRARARHRPGRLRPGPARGRRSAAAARASLYRKGKLMRKIIAGMFITLDGVVEAPEKWNPPYYDDELNQDVMPLLAAAGTHLYGRRSCELFRGVFTGPAAPPHAEMMTATSKVVVSATLTDPGWGPASVISSNITAAWTALKQQPGQDITVGASATLVRFLLDEHLLDELRLLVHPVVAGTGKRLFAETGGRVPLALLESRPHRTGVMTLRYAPAGATARVPPDSRHG